MYKQLKSRLQRNLLASVKTDPAHGLHIAATLRSVGNLVSLHPAQALSGPTSGLLKTMESGLWQKKAPLQRSPAVSLPLSSGGSTSLCTSHSVRSPWFGSTQKRLTGLSSAGLLVPMTAQQVAQKQAQLSWQHYFTEFSGQASHLKQQFERRMERWIGVNTTGNTWATVFPEDE